MKKINILLFLLFLGGVSFAVAPSVSAQSEGIFETNPFLTQKLTGYQYNTDEQVPIDPITIVTVPKDAFGKQVTLYVYKGVDNKIKSLIPSGQSSISSYGITFKDSGGSSVLPKSAIRIEVDNKYKNTQTFYYPILNGGIDQGSKKQLSGNAKTLSLLPISDTGFIISVRSSAISGNQANTGQDSLTQGYPIGAATNAPRAYPKNVTITPTPSTGNNNTGGQPSIPNGKNNLTKTQGANSLLPTAAVLVLVVIAILTVAFLLIRNKNRRTL